MKKKLLSIFVSSGILASESVFAQWNRGDNLAAVSGLPAGTIFGITFGLLDWILVIFEMVAVLAFVISGFQYLTAAGDDDQIETAKNNMKWSIVGVGAGIAGAIVIKAVDTLLNDLPVLF